MPPITFTDEDFKGVDYRQQDDPMVIAVDIDRFTIRKTLVDQGSSVDILYWKTLKAMRIAEAEMMPYDDHVVGFSGERVGTKGYIELYTTFGEGRTPGPSKFDTWSSTPTPPTTSSLADHPSTG